MTRMEVYRVRIIEVEVTATSEDQALEFAMSDINELYKNGSLDYQINRVSMDTPDEDEIKTICTCTECKHTFDFTIPQEWERNNEYTIHCPNCPHWEVAGNNFAHGFKPTTFDMTVVKRKAVTIVIDLEDNDEQYSWIDDLHALENTIRDRLQESETVTVHSITADCDNEMTVIKWSTDDIKQQLEEEFFKCENCGHYQHTTDFNECEECSTDALVAITEAEYDEQQDDEILHCEDRGCGKTLVEGKDKMLYSLTVGGIVCEACSVNHNIEEALKCSVCETDGDIDKDTGFICSDCREKLGT